ncbi:MAG TPA: glycosyltransferase family 4 protein [Blastocatellia bacterium]|nr:glycosyltransferase family 4 protein [Blastocatellia bacterium]
MRTLYLCYFGLREPLVQTQVLPYLRQLSKAGVEVTLLTFEPNRHTWSRAAATTIGAQLGSEGIRWHSRRYHKRPRILSTLFDIVAGAWQVVRIAKRDKIEVLHARAHVPMAIALIVRRWTGSRLVFDIRGLMAEEYADAGTWKEGSVIFRIVKWIEKTGIRQADQIVVLTRRMKEWLIEQGLAAENRIEVIPCCVDFTRFGGQSGRNVEGVNGRFEVIYAGAAAGLYLVDEMASFFLALRELEPRAFLRVLTTTRREQVVERLERQGLKESDFWVGPVLPADVPAYLRRARVGISFRRPTFSQIAASPTKIPEYLAAGLPVVCNYGVGDIDEMVEAAEVGIVVRSFDNQAYVDGAREALELAARPDIAARCLEVATRYFDLERIGAAGYGRVYDRLRKDIHPTEASVTVPY